MSEYTIFQDLTEKQFQELALATFNDQFLNTAVYNEFCKALGVTPGQVQKLSDIPFLPIQFFKSHTVLRNGKTSEIVFSSSGTTNSITSKHHVPDLSLYRQSFVSAFEATYGPTDELVILALLPSYLERDGSSLVYMVDQLIQQTGNQHSGFYLNDLDALREKLEFLEDQKQRTLLIGVSFALLDFIERRPIDLKYCTVMETGGMKGRRKELIREELHKILMSGFGVEEIHSEYGMTELLSQAYSKGQGMFNCPPWMKVLTRDTEDPFHYVTGKTGGINVIDLANSNSCSFIATQDLGKVYDDGSFEILGRFDHSDIRGCNLMML